MDGKGRRVVCAAFHPFVLGDTSAAARTDSGRPAGRALVGSQWAPRSTTPRILPAKKHAKIEKIGGCRRGEGWETKT